MHIFATKYFALLQLSGCSQSYDYWLEFGNLINACFCMHRASGRGREPWGHKTDI